MIIYAVINYIYTTLSNRLNTTTAIHEKVDQVIPAYDTTDTLPDNVFYSDAIKKLIRLTALHFLNKTH